MNRTVTRSSWRFPFVFAPLVPFFESVALFLQSKRPLTDDRKALQCMQDSLTQEREAGPPIALSLDELELVDLSFHLSVGIDQREPGQVRMEEEIHRSGETYLLNYRGETYLPNAAPATCQAESLPDWYLISCQTRL